jgi:hypothetical protein
VAWLANPLAEPGQYHLNFLSEIQLQSVALPEDKSKSESSSLLLHRFE